MYKAEEINDEYYTNEIFNDIIHSDDLPGDVAHVKVTVSLSIDLSSFKFPLDARGKMIYDPLHCLDDVIIDGLFKPLDPSSMGFIDGDSDQSILIEAFNVVYSEWFKRLLEFRMQKGDIKHS